MGLSLLDLREIVRLRHEGLLPADFAVAEIGAQQIANEVLRDPDILDALADAFGASPRRFGAAPLPPTDLAGIEPLPSEAPPTRPLWEWLGCSYFSTDIVEMAGAVALDLNFDEVPQVHRGRYHLVTNFGTTEHVANQIQAMKVIHDLATADGVMIHTVPTDGYVNHGLVKYTPNFFWQLAKACQYRLLRMSVHVQAQGAFANDSILQAVARSDPDAAATLAAHRVSDVILHVVLQKVASVPFVPPIDLPDGVTVDSEHLRGRYRAAVDAVSSAGGLSLGGSIWRRLLGRRSIARG